MQFKSCRDTANTDYIVSYRTNDNYIGANLFFDPAGDVAYDGVDDDAFTDPFGILSAPQNTVVGDAGVNSNGIYKCGSTAVMPDQKYKSSNYWVDVTFDPDNAPVFTSSATPGVAENATAVVDLTANDADSPSVTFSITGGIDAGLFQIAAVGHTLEFITPTRRCSPLRRRLALPTVRPFGSYFSAAFRGRSCPAC